MNKIDLSVQNRVTRLELAQQLYREFYALCFWHMKPDLVVTEEIVPTILKGLRTHGGRKGIMAAARLVE